MEKTNPNTPEEYEIGDAASLKKFMAAAFIQGIYSRFDHVYVGGSSAFLVSFVAEAIVSEVKVSSSASDFLSLGDTDAELRSMIELYDQPALLSGKSFCHVKISRQNKNLARHLKNLDAQGRAGSSLLVSQVASKIPAPLQKELKRLRFCSLFCSEPKGQKLVAMIQQLALFSGLRIGLEESQFLVECCGEDLQKISNELKKVVLVTANERQTDKITKDRISQICSFLRQDHIFHLDRLLLTRKHAEASLFIADLVKQGESSLAILGLLARHCRNAIRVQQNLNSRRPIGMGLKLPQAVLKSYNGYVGRSSGYKFERALRLCQDVDAAIKSTGSARDISLLTQIITLLS